MPSGITKETLTIIEDLGTEDASGNKQTRTTTQSGAYVEFTDSEIRNATGPVSADSARVMIDDPSSLAAWGDTWSLKSGDSLTRVKTGTTVSVLSATPSYSPRTGVLHHVEAVCG